MAFPGYRMKDAKCQVLSSDEWERREEKGWLWAVKFRGSQGETELV